MMKILFVALIRNMRISNRGSFLDVSVTHGIFNMAASVKVANLLIGYLIFGLIILVRWWRKSK